MALLSKPLNSEKGIQRRVRQFGGDPGEVARVEAACKDQGEQPEEGRALVANEKQCS